MQPNFRKREFLKTVDKKTRTLIEINSNAGELFISMQPASHEEDAKYIFKESRQLCQKIYSELYPDYLVREEDPYDYYACIFYSKKSGCINSMMRVCFDSEHGIPAQSSLTSEISALRTCGVSLAEPGRFVIDDSKGLYSKYLRAAYQLAVMTEIDAYILQVRDEHVSFYTRYCGATPLSSTSAPSGCTNLCWSIPRTPQRFFRAFGRDQSGLETCLINMET